MESLGSDLYFKTADTDFELQSCYRLRFQVYCKEKRWLPAGNFPDGLEIDEYDEKAVHVIALDEDFTIVGLMRILLENNYGKLPYLNHPAMKGERIDLPNCAELTRFVITPSKYRYYVLKGIFRAAYQVSRRLGVENWIFVSEPSMIRFMDRFKFYFTPFCTPAKYYGGFTLVATCNVAATEEIWRQKDPETLTFNTSEATILQPQVAPV
jgi:N-acyl-L-homoserine lactone synthetase